MYAAIKRAVPTRVHLSNLVGTAHVHVRARQSSLMCIHVRAPAPMRENCENRNPFLVPCLFARARADPPHCEHDVRCIFGLRCAADCGYVGSLKAACKRVCLQVGRPGCTTPTGSIASVGEGGLNRNCHFSVEVIAATACQGTSETSPLRRSMGGSESLPGGSRADACFIRGTTSSEAFHLQD